MSLASTGKIQLHSNPYSRRLLPQRCALPVTASIKARWTFDTKFGRKQAALKLVDEFVTEVSIHSSPFRSVQISHGAIGVPESNVELEMEFDSMAGVELFWSMIPPMFQKEWSDQMQSVIVDGSARWTLHHVVPISTAPIQPTHEGSPQLIIPKASPPIESTAKLLSNDQKEQQQDGVSSLEDKQTMRDWKGDVIKINPGDKLPFNFT